MDLGDIQWLVGIKPAESLGNLVFRVHLQDVLYRPPYFAYSDGRICPDTRGRKYQADLSNWEFEDSLNHSTLKRNRSTL